MVFVLLGLALTPLSDHPVYVHKRHSSGPFGYFRLLMSSLSPPCTALTIELHIYAMAPPAVTIYVCFRYAIATKLMIGHELDISTEGSTTYRVASPVRAQFTYELN
jgi:hypothetical protein